MGERLGRGFWQQSGCTAYTLNLKSVWGILTLKCA